MNHIGSIIATLREEKKISRAQLAEGICSEKYIYMIETGQRNPSAEILKSFGNKLNEDLFRYMGFLMHDHPVHVAKTLDLLRERQRLSDYAGTKEILDQILGDPDFLIRPNYFHFFYHRITYDIFMEGKLDESFEELLGTLKEIEENYPIDDFIMLGNSLLSIISQIKGQDDKALYYIKKANALTEKKSFNIGTNIYVYTRVKIALISMLFRSGKIDEAIEEGYKTLETQNKNDILAHIYFTHMYLAFSLFEKGDIREATRNFHKGLFFLINAESEVDARLMLNEEYFTKIAEHPATHKILVDIFKKHFNFD